LLHGRQGKKQDCAQTRRRKSEAPRRPAHDSSFPFVRRYDHARILGAISRADPLKLL
jgi:hypothetical protein